MKLKRLTANDPQAYKKVNDLMEVVERLLNIRVEPPLRLTFSGGSPQFTVGEHGFWARIIDHYSSSGSVASGEGNRYLFRRLVEDRDGTWQDSGETNNNAYEVSSSFVPMDSIQWLRPSKVGDYRFVSGGESFSGDSNSSLGIEWECKEVMADLVCDGNSTVRQWGLVLQPKGVPLCSTGTSLEITSWSPVGDDGGDDGGDDDGGIINGGGDPIYGAEDGTAGGAGGTAEGPGTYAIYNVEGAE